MKNTNKSSFWKTVLLIIVAVFILNGIFSAKLSGDITDKDIAAYVHDDADLISTNTAKYICRKNRSLEKQTGAQIIFATVNSLGGKDITDTAYDLFGEYAPGGDDNNGILVLIAKKERKAYALQGRAIEDTFSAGTLGLMINGTVTQALENNTDTDYVRELFDDLIGHYESMYSITVTEDNLPSSGNDDGLFDRLGRLLGRLTGLAKKLIKAAVILTFAAFGLIAAVMLIVLWNRDKKQQNGTPPAQPSEKVNKNPYSRKQ